jgi:hypothetical protein
MAQEKQAEGKTTAEGKDVAVRKSAESKALSPFQEMEDMMERMEHMFEEFFPGRRMRSSIQTV